MFAALDALPWNDVAIGHTQNGRGHGRIDRRTIRVLPAPDDLPFPHVNQVTLIERYVSDLDGNPRSAVAVLGVTSLTAARADPARLASLTRDHWSIESLHWLRDTLYREDNSTARTRGGPRVMAGLRILWRSGPSASSDAPTSPRPPYGRPRHAPALPDPRDP